MEFCIRCTKLNKFYYQYIEQFDTISNSYPPSNATGLPLPATHPQTPMACHCLLVPNALGIKTITVITRIVGLLIGWS